MEVTTRSKLVFLTIIELLLQQLNLWGDSDEADATCLKALLQHEAAAAASVKKSKKFEEVKDKEILKLHATISFKDIGMWILHFDLINWPQAWSNLTEHYLAQKLPGVIRLSLANDERNGSKTMLCFVGPANNESHCLNTGRIILQVMQYQRQLSHCNYPPFVYYKLRNVAQYKYRLFIE
jgi:hypothetical protein